MSSSFPDSFSHIIGNSHELVKERRLDAVVRQRFNRLDLTYGDWGSTRPEQHGGGGGIPSRIDVPCPDRWEIFRADPDNDPGFPEIAWVAQHHSSFDEAPDCWGKQIVAATDDAGAGVTGTRVASEARINMHMTVQSGAISIMPTEETPYHD
jgi:Beta protein